MVTFTKVILLSCSSVLLGLPTSLKPPSCNQGVCHMEKKKQEKKAPLPICNIGNSTLKDVQKLFFVEEKNNSSFMPRKAILIVEATRYKKTKNKK